jgi:hypothetical protein
MANPTRIIQYKELDIAVRAIPLGGTSEGEVKSECDQHPYAITYAGHGRTNAGGSWTVSLPAINCIKIGPIHNADPSVVATPTGNGLLDDIPSPYILVTRTTPTSITVWSFHPNGERAGNVEFSWHCAVEGELE